MKQKYIHLLLLILSLSIFGQNSFAQEGKTFLQIIQDNMEAGNGELVSTILKIINLNTESFEGSLVLTSDEELNIIGKSKKQIIIPPNDSVFVSVKMLIAQSVSAKETYHVNAALYNAQQKLIAKGQMAVKIGLTKEVHLFVRDRSIVMDERGGFFHIEVRLQNDGNTTQHVVLLTTLPNELKDDFRVQINVKIKAFQDTTVVVRRQITRNMMRLDNFNIHITGLYKRGNAFGRETVRVHAIKNSRKYREPGIGLFPQRENLIALRAQNIGEENTVYEGSLNTHFDFPNKGEITLNMRGRWRKNIDELYFQNTYLAYSSDRFGGRVGNIYENMAMYLNGRGAKAFYQTKNQKNRVELGALEKSYHLFRSPHEKPGNSFWATYAFREEGEERGSSEATFSTSFIYDNDFYQDQKNYLLAFHGEIIDTTNLSIRGGVYGGSTSTFEGNERPEYGFAAELKLKAKAGLFSFYSDNFASTGYYPGRRRGALNFNERIGLHLEKYRFWFFFNHYSYQPKYIASSPRRENEFGSSRAELGVSRNIGRFSLSVSQKYSSEYRKLMYLDNGRDTDLSAMRLGFALNYTSADYNHTFFLETETGFSDANATSLNAFQFRGRFSYNWGFFHLNGLYQIGAFYLGQVNANRYYPDLEKYKRWYVSPNIRHDFFNKKLELTLGLNYSHDVNSGESIRIMGRAHYDLPYGMEIFVGTEYYDYSFGGYSDQRVEFGIIKHFSSPKFGVNNNSLKVFVYKEMDGNTGYSQNDEIAVNQLLRINEKIFKTDGQGIVEYKKIPEGAYTIQFNGFTNWYATDREVYVEGDGKIQIGLHKMTTVKGSVNYSSTILSYDINKKLGGLKVLAVNADEKVFSTRTSNNGQFVLFVPKGKYRISLVIPKSMKHVDILNNNQSIETYQEHLTRVSFRVAIKEKQVEYKKFTAN